VFNQEEVKKIQSKGMQVIPWTVNDVATMKKLQSWGVDGIITDYPDRTKHL
jgi:glycerophosphoryl diester phosphodiesterase